MARRLCRDTITPIFSAEKKLHETCIIFKMYPLRSFSNLLNLPKLLKYCLVFSVNEDSINALTKVRIFSILKYSMADIVFI